MACHNTIDDQGQGSRQGDTAPILARRRHPVALSETLSMPHQVMPTHHLGWPPSSSRHIKTTTKIMF
jgi:hypothetical protein